jgi:hypothetical protein
MSPVLKAPRMMPMPIMVVVSATRIERLRLHHLHRRNCGIAGLEAKP